MEDTGYIILLAAVLAGTVFVRLLLQRTRRAADFAGFPAKRTELETKALYYGMQALLQSRGER